jgi:hypothetical protein
MLPHTRSPHSGYLLGILATVTAAKKIGGDVDIVVAGFSLESTVGKEAAAVAGKFFS